MRRDRYSGAGNISPGAKQIGYIGRTEKLFCTRTSANTSTPEKHDANAEKFQLELKEAREKATLLEKMSVQ